MAVTLVQKVTSPEFSGITNSQALPGPTTSGNTLIVCLNLYGQSGGADIPQDVGVSDGANTFQRINSSSVQRVATNWGQHIVFYVATNIVGQGATETINTTLNEAAWNWIGVWEVTPAVFDQSDNRHQDRARRRGQRTLSPGPLTPSANGAFMLATANFDGSNSLFTANGTGWTFNANTSASSGSMFNASKPSSLGRCGLHELLHPRPRFRDQACGPRSASVSFRPPRA